MFFSLCPECKTIRAYEALLEELGDDVPVLEAMTQELDHLGKCGVCRTFQEVVRHAFVRKFGAIWISKDEK